MNTRKQPDSSNKLAILPMWVIDRIKEEMRLGPAAWQAITEAVEKAEVPQALPCEVKLPPGTVIGQGTAVSTLMLAIQQRASYPAQAQVFSSVEPEQSHPDPIAWMGGTAIWWTKEEAERDAAETGLPIVGLGPMTGAAPAEQQQGEPVAWLAKTLKGSLAGTLGLARYDQRLNPELYDGPFPVFRHADPGEVERLREGIAKHWKVVCDQRAEIESLRDQLAKVVRSGALTAPEHEALEAECCALSVTAEPSAPAAQA